MYDPRVLIFSSKVVWYGRSCAFEPQWKPITWYVCSLMCVAHYYLQAHLFVFCIVGLAWLHFALLCQKSVVWVTYYVVICRRTRASPRVVLIAYNCWYRTFAFTTVITRTKKIRLRFSEGRGGEGGRNSGVDTRAVIVQNAPILPGPHFFQSENRLSEI